MYVHSIPKQSKKPKPQHHTVTIHTEISKSIKVKYLQEWNLKCQESYCQELYMNHLLGQRKKTTRYFIFFLFYMKQL